MRNVTSIIIFFFLIIFNVNAQESFKIDNHGLKWFTDYDKAKETSIKEKKLILLYFTGSDWCGACKMLEKNYFAKKQFKKISESFILCELDYPKSTFDKTYVKKHFEEFKRRFEISDKYETKTYPTIIILNRKELAVGRISGYLGKETSKKYSNLLKAIIDIKNFIN